MSNLYPAQSEHRNYGYPAGAVYLGIGQRTLWSLAAPRGPIQTLSIGNRVLFTRDALDAYIDSRSIVVEPGRHE